MSVVVNTGSKSVYILIQKFAFRSARPVHSELSRKRTVEGEVTLNFELAKPRGYCVHTSANFDGDPPRLVVYRANLRFCCGFVT